MAGKFERKKSSNDKYYFSLLASNGQVILTSEMYESKASALNGIESVKKNAADASRYERADGSTPDAEVRPLGVRQCLRAGGQEAERGEREHDADLHQNRGEHALLLGGELEGPAQVVARAGRRVARRR